MKLNGYQKYFTGNLAKKDKKNEFGICKLAKNMKTSLKIYINFKTNIIYVQYITLVVVKLMDFQGL